MSSSAFLLVGGIHSPGKRTPTEEGLSPSLSRIAIQCTVVKAASRTSTNASLSFNGRCVSLAVLPRSAPLFCSRPSVGCRLPPSVAPSSAQRASVRCTHLDVPSGMKAASSNLRAWLLDPRTGPWLRGTPSWSLWRPPKINSAKRWRPLTAVQLRTPTAGGRRSASLLCNLSFIFESVHIRSS